ncbi:MAG: transposase [Sedimenticola sp.]
MSKRNRNHSPEFRLEAAQLVVDQGYTLQAAADSMGVSKGSMENWARHLREERKGKTPTSESSIS